jgi:hypothetical protein
MKWTGGRAKITCNAVSALGENQDERGEEKAKGIVAEKG